MIFFIIPLTAECKEKLATILHFYLPFIFQKLAIYVSSDFTENKKLHCKSIGLMIKN